MNVTPITKPPYKYVAWVLCGIFVLLLVLEAWRYAVKPSLANKQTIINEALDETASQFINSQQELLAQSRELAGALQSQIERGNSQARLFEKMQDYPGFWGTALYRINQPVAWNDFSLEPFQEIRFSNRMNSYVEVQKQNNVTYWLCHVGFVIQTEEGEIPYHLYTAKRIQQSNALPFADEREYSILETSSAYNFYTLNLSIYNPVPDRSIASRTLNTLADDSVGAVYAVGGDYDEALKQWRSSNQFWRAFFALISFLLISSLLYYRVDEPGNWKSLLIQLFIIASGWLVFEYISIAEYWLPAVFESAPANAISSYQRICDFFTDALLFLLTALTVHRNIRGRSFHLQSTWFFSSIIAAFIVGLFNTGSIILVFERCYRLASTSGIPLLTLQIFPGIATIVFYLALGTMLWALSLMLLSVNQFLLRSCKDQAKLATVICGAGFIISLFITLLLGSDIFGLNWSFIICSVYFLLIFLLSFTLFRYPFIWRQISPLRNAAVGSLIIAIAGSTLIYNAQMSSQDRELAQTLSTYNRQQDGQAEQLVSDILSRLENEYSSLTTDELQNRTSFIQARFTQTVETFLNQTGPLYSLDLKLVKPDLEVVANYSTELNSPNWVNVFDLRRLKVVTDIQQITKNTIRPIVQQPELENAEDYRTFYRGWIPVFGAGNDEPIAWILCSVYLERPDFNKPIRAVMSSVRYRDWSKSYAIQQYNNRLLQQVVYEGVGENYPIYNVLQPAEIRALQQDSTVYYTSAESGHTYRNLLVGQPAGGVSKASMVLPDYQHILFSFFRLSFTLLISGFLLLMIYRWIKEGQIVFFGKNEQFKYRILDSFLLASLIFLVMLVITTHYAIKQQNRDLVQQQLSEKLESIATATQQNVELRQLDQGITLSLDALTTSLNVDASFYRNGVVKESTTPQIYQQHLLPSALPFTVYRDLFQSQKRQALTNLMLDRQDLLIGYRSIFSGDGEPVAAIAIPTFVQSPKYDQQLVETTSYLIILYLVVFGIFIIGTTFISRQLTRPLHYIRQGLQKISRGEMDTTIPVTSKDEIGNLAIAYNHMVSRLKELQTELAAAEREAAWQEMAQQVAHEIKNPLTPMKLNIQHLQRQLGSGDYSIDELKQKIKSITQNLIVQIQSLNNIASDFTKFSKPIEEEFTPVPVNRLLYSIVDLYAHDEQISFSTQCSASPSTVFAAQDELRRVFINLVKNAREAMPEGGTIHLKTYLRGQSIFVEVEDNGMGIPEDDKTKIFVPNFSTKSSGTGLGLAICKKVIEAHKGSISFASIEGEGTTFVVKLPLHTDYNHAKSSIKPPRL